MVSPSPPRPHPAACLPSSTPFSRRLPPPSQVLLDPDPFLTELTRLYDRTRAAGTVWVTFKRSTLSPKKREREAADAPAESFRCLVRATDGKKKISTSISAKEQARFQAAYATVLRAHMDALKKREKKDKKKPPGSKSLAA
eukprot:SM000026S08852  [mRNA]  locus=s26:32171:33333:- [translate_table: standard]